ncbi:uncharacterized protein BYT42DRAFT_580282 [Radiomyces spectabilis]|uniref:uncharacterized protein n=1 Tax=Radiomyces spectabilis TaxID=64574 RepID=UPI00221F63D0|nr:uncharacterized protein BYT42DRAFT_580282 [Radiomyces spectabilis]KAI8371449.1 hypothetical protein BYT42DRAFT_580282 [Radiomyces spectabilis]
MAQLPLALLTLFRLHNYLINKVWGNENHLALSFAQGMNFCLKKKLLKEEEIKHCEVLENTTILPSFRIMAKHALVLLLFFVVTFNVITAEWIGTRPGCLHTERDCPITYVDRHPICFARTAEEAKECPSACGEFGDDCDLSREVFKQCCIR